jgi:hypothetical protein
MSISTRLTVTAAAAALSLAALFGAQFAGTGVHGQVSADAASSATAAPSATATPAPGSTATVQPDELIWG